MIPDDMCPCTPGSLHRQDSCESDPQNQRNSGHGHVFPRPDGVKARCGGPALCSNCRSDEALRSAGHLTRAGSHSDGPSSVNDSGPRRQAINRVASALVDTLLADPDLLWDLNRDGFRQSPPMDDTTVPTPYLDAVVELGRVALDFGQIKRITYHPDRQTQESDTTHTVMLGLVACGFADHSDVPLDKGLIAQFAYVHDLVEVYAGDTPTLRITDTQRSHKKRHEAEALGRLHDEFDGDLPWLGETLDAYETQNSPEARFVKALDKLLPKITHILNNGATLDREAMWPDELRKRYDDQRHELERYFAEFPELRHLHTYLVDRTMAERGTIGK